MKWYDWLIVGLAAYGIFLWCFIRGWSRLPHNVEPWEEQECLNRQSLDHQDSSD